MPLKLGVRHLEQLPHVTTIFGTRKKIDLWLYGEILRSRAEMDKWLPLFLLCHAANRASKWTEERRFPKVDDQIVHLVENAKRQNSTAFRVHDIGVSDGRTAVDLFRRLSIIRPIDYTASDLCPLVYIVRHEANGWSVAFDQDGSAIQYAGWGFVVTPPAPDRLLLYPVNRLFQVVFKRWFEIRAARALAGIEVDSLNDLDEIRTGVFRIFKVPLLSRECLTLLHEQPAFRFMRHDVQQPTAERYDLVRVMNVLNHLSDEEQIRAFRACCESLQEDGILVIGRTLGGKTASSIWCRHGSQLRLILDLDGGAEIKKLLPQY